MGSGSYSFAAYSALANDREYTTKSADAVFKNRSLSAQSDIRLSNVNARSFNTQVKPEMINTGVRESRDSNEHLIMTNSLFDIVYYKTTYSK